MPKKTIAELEEELGVKHEAKQPRSRTLAELGEVIKATPKNTHTKSKTIAELEAVVKAKHKLEFEETLKSAEAAESDNAPKKSTKIYFIISGLAALAAIAVIIISALPNLLGISTDSQSSTTVVDQPKSYDDLYGSWVEEGDNSLWAFKEGEFWWYGSGVTGDNYWHGTAQILSGLEGLDSVGIHGKRADEFIAESDVPITYDDIYSVIVYPEEFISGGQPVKDIEITDSAKWQNVWIISKHDDGRITAKVFDVEYYYTINYSKLQD